MKKIATSIVCVGLAAVAVWGNTQHYDMSLAWLGSFLAFFASLS